MKNYRLLVILMACTFFLTCKKEATPLEILLKHNWIIVRWTVNPAVLIGTETFTDISSVVGACTKDDVVTFKPDKTILKDEGSSKCNASNPQTSADGTWDLGSDASSLYLNNTSLTQNQGSIQATINKLDDSELNITLPNLTVNTTKTSLTLRFLPQ